MAYSDNVALVIERAPLLAELSQGRSCRWVTEQDRAVTRRLAFRIREALSIASKHPDQFPELASAYHNFSIHEIRPGLIEAKPKSIAHVQVDATQVAVDTRPTPIHGVAPWGREASTVAKRDAQGVIDSWMGHLPSSDPMTFQQAALDDAELTVLWNWATKRNPRLMMMVSSSGTITLSLRMAEMDAYAWAPPQPPKAPERTEFDI